MKKLLFALAITFACSVNAQEVFATANNSGGGKIVLLATQDDCRAGRRGMFATLPTGETSFGCWSLSGDFIRVKYHDGSVRMYALGPNYWELAPKYKKKIAQKVGMQ